MPISSMLPSRYRDLMQLPRLCGWVTSTSFRHWERSWAQNFTSPSLPALTIMSRVAAQDCVTSCACSVVSASWNPLKR